MRVGLIGSNCVQRYIHALSRLPQANPVGLTGTVTAPNIPAYSDTGDLLAQKLDAAVICALVENRRHMIEAAAGSVRYLLCPLPFGATLDDAQAVIDLCRDRATLLRPALPLRHLPILHLLKAEIDDGAVGDLIAVKLLHHRQKQFASTTGVVIDHAPMAVDLLCWLTGRDITDVYAEIGTGLLTGGPSEDSAVLSLGLSGGAYATVDVSLTLPDSAPLPEMLKLEVWGTGGNVMVDVFRQQLEVYAAETKFDYWGSDATELMLRDFSTQVADGLEPLPTAESALTAHRVAIAARHAAAERRPVKPDDV